MSPERSRLLPIRSAIAWTSSCSSRIQDESLYYESRKHDGSLPIVGVNTYKAGIRGEAGAAEPPEPIRSTEIEKRSQVEATRKFLAHNEAHVDAALESLLIQRFGLALNLNIHFHMLLAHPAGPGRRFAWRDRMPCTPYPPLALTSLHSRFSNPPRSPMTRRRRVFESPKLRRDGR